jgi:hypothetical protein
LTERQNASDTAREPRVTSRVILRHSVLVIIATKDVPACGGKAKGKNQKAKVADQSRYSSSGRPYNMAMRLNNSFLPFASCLLPFAFLLA